MTSSKRPKHHIWSILIEAMKDLGLAIAVLLIAGVVACAAIGALFLARTYMDKGYIFAIEAETPSAAHGLPIAGLPINPAVDQSNIHNTICKVGWTKTVRPPQETTEQIKAERLAKMGRPLSDARLFELDHIIPLELGGHPIAASNLQMQLWPEAHEKDLVENCLRAKVCSGWLKLDEARFVIWTDWRQAKQACGPAVD